VSEACAGLSHNQRVEEQAKEDNKVVGNLDVDN